MKHIYFLLTLLLMSSNSLAESEVHIEKPWSIGVGPYANTLVYNDGGPTQNDRFDGLALSVGYIVSKNIAVRANYFSLEYDLNANSKSKGFDLLVHYGINLLGKGLKLYLGGGVFKDKISLSGTDESLSGLQLNVGLGHNWESVSINLILGLRDPGEYESFARRAFSTDLAATSISTSLILSARF